MTDALLPIKDLAANLGVASGYVIPYGEDKAKLRLEARAASGRDPGKLILVSAITPTGAGEGKTTVSIGLAQGLAAIGEQVCIALREPSLGPTFGMKGGATGGGASVLVPATDINLHFTGDFHAVTSAHNLLAALLDNHLHFSNDLAIDPRRVYWPRVLDVNDRALRQIVTGLGGTQQGVPRETGFDITPASEIMAALCLATDFDDLRARLSRMIIADSLHGEPITAADLDAVGAMMVLLKDALRPNLVQTCEGVPALVHGGPFANIAHGCNSVVATRMAMAHADWTVTEAGFGFDLGAEKFFDIKCVSAGLECAAVVLVVTVRALKRHGGVAKNKLGTPDPAAVTRGLGNLQRHLESIRLFGQPAVVAINRFASDSEGEIDVIRGACEQHGVACAVADIFSSGGAGGRVLAEAVVAATRSKPPSLQPLYDWKAPIKDKIWTIASNVYGAGSIHYSKDAELDLARIENLGYAGLPVCIAKTPLSLTDDPARVGSPERFEITVRNVVLSAGAGFVVPLLGAIVRMPGLPSRPQAAHIDLTDGTPQGIKG
jgi:formate--tetrahydrofolate ligase